MWPAAALQNTVLLNWCLWPKTEEDCPVACLKFSGLAVTPNTECVKNIDGDNLSSLLTFSLTSWVFLKALTRQWGFVCLSILW